MTTAHASLLARSPGILDACICGGRQDALRPHVYDDDHLYHEMVERLLLVSCYRDQETGAHLARTSAYTHLVASWLGVPPDEAARMATAAALHDLGKIGVPDAVLLKPAPLTPAEWQLMQQHPRIGARLLEGSASPLMEMAWRIALTHHERWDGSGYPQGLRGEAIPLAGRIVMLGDQYDALRSARPYKPAFDHATTCDILLRGDGRTLPRHFEPRLLAAFRDLHQEFAAIYAERRDAGHGTIPEVITPVH